MGNLPPIPEIDDAELHHAISSLAQAAFIWRGVFLQLADGKPLKEIFAERLEYLELSDKIVEHWCKYFGIDGDDDYTLNGSAKG